MVGADNEVREGVEDQYRLKLSSFLEAMHDAVNDLLVGANDRIVEEIQFNVLTKEGCSIS